MELQTKEFYSFGTREEREHDRTPGGDPGVRLQRTTAQTQTALFGDFPVRHEKANGARLTLAF